MGTIVDKFNKTLDTKARIAAAIEEKTGKPAGDVFASYPDQILQIPSGGAWTGHADEVGLKAIGWTDDDIAYYQKYGVNWNEEDDQYHLVPEDNKALYGVLTASNISTYSGRIVYMPKIDTSGRKDLSNLFANCYSLVAIPKLDTSAATSMYGMFSTCRSMVCVPILDTSSVTSMDRMFYGCYTLQFIPNIDMSNTTTVERMFYACYSLRDIRLLNVPKISSIREMFYNCYSLTSLTVDTNSVVADNAFFACRSIVHLWINRLSASISPTYTSLLSKDSLLYMIENAASPFAVTRAPDPFIVITLSSYCYNKYKDDPDITAALSKKTFIQIASA